MSAKNTERTWLTHRQACEHLQIAEQTLYRLVRAGKVAFHQLGGKRLYDVAELDRAVREYREEEAEQDEQDTTEVVE